MKNLSRFTKGILLTALAVTVFCVNVGPIANFANTNHESRVSDVASAKVEITNLFVEKAYAADPTTTSGTTESEKPATPPDAKKLIDTISKASTLINTVFNPLILFVTRQIGGLLGNDYIFGGKMGDMLHGIWVVSRNIVNIAFVLILLFMALRHIFGGEENTDLKKTMPIFVIMLIAVNFSWLATRIVLDAANVATNVVFAIPSGVKGVVGKDLKLADIKCTLSPDGKKITGSCKPSKMWIPFDATETSNRICTKKDIEDADKGYADAYPPGGLTGPPTPEAQKYLFKKTFCWENLDIAQFQQDNAAYYLTYSMSYIQNLAIADTGDSISKVGIGTLFGIVIQIVYLVAFFSLFIALIIRVAALWMLVALSPFIVLLLFLEKASVKVGGEGAKEWLGPGAFVGWAFAPAKVAAVWSIGFIMVTAGQTVSKEFFATLDKQGSVTSEVFTVNSLFMGMETIQQFIWLIMTIGIVWMGTFAVLTNLKVGKQLFDAINRQGVGIAQWIGRSPKWAPIIPMLDDKGQLNWNRRAGLGVISPLKLLEGVEAKYSPETAARASKLAKAETNFKNNLTDPQAEDIKNVRNTPERALKAFMDPSKMDKKDLAETDQKQIENILTTSGKFKKEDIPTIARDLKNAAGKIPGTVTPPKAVAGAAGAALKPSDIEKGVTEGMRNVVQQDEFKTRIANLGDAGKEIEKKAAANVAAKLKDRKDVTPQIIEAENKRELNELLAKAGAPAKPAAAAPAGPPKPATPPAAPTTNQPPAGPT